MKLATAKSAITGALLIVGLLLGCAPAAPTVAPTRPASAPATAPAAAPTAPAPAAAAPTVAVPTAASKDAQPKVSPAASTATPPTSIKRGGTLRHARWITYPGFDAHTVSVSPLPGLRAIYDAPLFAQYNEQTGTMEVKPELFESWNMPEPTTVLFKIRKGVKFHDGTDFDAEAARFQHRPDGEQQEVHRQGLPQRGKERGQGGRLHHQSEPECPQRLPTADAHWLRAPIGIVSKAAVEKLGDDEFSRKPVGTGPFAFSDWVSDDRLTVKKFNGYWQKGADGQALPYLDGILFRFIPDASVSLVELRVREPRDNGQCRSQGCGYHQG